MNCWAERPVIDPAELVGKSKFLFQMKLVQSALEPGAAYDCDYCLPLDGPSAEESGTTSVRNPASVTASLRRAKRHPGRLWRLCGSFRLKLSQRSCR